MSHLSIPATCKAYKLPASHDLYTDESAFQLTELTVPLPGPHQLLVRLHVASLNYRDLMIASGHFPGPYAPNAIPLSCGAGEVVAIGKDVTKFAIGDRVLNSFFENWEDGPVKPEHATHALGGSVDGVLTQYRLFSSSVLAHIPSFLSYEEAATVPVNGVTAWHALFGVEPPISSSSSVLVPGTGGLSLFALRLAKAAGARTIITSSSSQKIDRAISTYGAFAGINWVKNPEWSAEVIKLTKDGQGVDRALEVGGAGTVLQTISATKVGGTVILLGVALSGNGTEPPATSLLAHTILKSINLKGLYVGSHKMLEDVLVFMEKHKIHPAIDKVFAWTDVKQAYAYQRQGPDMGMIVLQID